MDQKVIDNNFAYHPPCHVTRAGFDQSTRAAAHTFATLINELCPDSREKSSAMTNLEQSVMWANAAIARNE